MTRRAGRTITGAGIRDRPRRTASPPHPPDLPTELNRGDTAQLVHDGSFTDVELSEVALPDQSANGVAFATSRLVKLDLSGSQLPDLRLADCTLMECNLANVQAQRAAVTRVTVENSRLTGIRFHEGTLLDATIRGCRVDLASFGFSRLTRVTFENCMLAQADYLDAQLESVCFHRCDLTRADFRGVRMRRCEFRRCDLTGLQGVANLRGAAMEWPDIVELAGVWAAALGIEVLEDTL